MSRKMSTIYEGKFMDALTQTYIDEFGTDAPFSRVTVKTRRKTLEKPELIDIMQAINKTVNSVFERAGLPVVISEQDAQVLSALENLSAQKQNSVLTTIREICDPWWVDILDTDKSVSYTTVARFKRFGVHKYAASAEKDSLSPLLQSLLPCRFITKIDTDTLPQLSYDADVPISYLMDIPMSEVRFYSENANADRVFTEYKLILSESLRDVVRKIIFAI